MLSMSARSEETAPVWHYDGVTGRRRAPLLALSGEGFVLEEGGAIDGPYAFSDLVALGDAQYGLRTRPGWRILFDQSPPATIAERLPVTRRYGGLVDRMGLWPAAIVFALLSMVAVAVILATPAMLVRFIPSSFEARLGDLMVGDFGDRACASPEGMAALRKLSERMQVPPHVTLRVVNVPMVNAVTLPGGHVVLFRGLLRDAASPDEVAGVLAHEIGHVENRDVLESLVRQLGLSVVLGGLDGNVGGYTNALLAASYSRAAESRADGYAIDALVRAGVSPVATAVFFERMSVGEIKDEGAGAVLGYLASHPVSSERGRRFRAAGANRMLPPALTPAEWHALREICGDEPAGWKPSLGF